MEHRSNKTIVIEFYKQVIGQHDFSLIDTFISDTYIQHSPMAKDGKAGIMEMLQMLKNLPKPAQTVTPLTMAIADGDIVALQLDINIMGKRALVVDIFRIENGKLAEHWDVVQFIPQEAVNDLNREIHIEDDKTNDNKILVTNYVNNVFVKKRFEQASGYFRVGHQSQNTLKFSGRLNEVLSNQFREYELMVYNVIGEGNLVLVQSSYRDANNDVVLNDIFEVDNDQIVSSWSVEQAIPDKMMHDNGML